MNMRILKKLSKRAQPYLHRIGDRRQQFRAGKEENYTSLIIRDISRLERSCAAHTSVIGRETLFRYIAPKIREGSQFPYVTLRYPSHPIKGTIMVGGMEGYYEPEWDEETAWEALSTWVHNQFIGYDPKTQNLYPTRILRTPSEIFQAADELLEPAQ